jgi:hypothetical protein
MTTGHRQLAPDHDVTRAGDNIDAREGWAHENLRVAAQMVDRRL